MKIKVDVEFELPEGWEFDGLWMDRPHKDLHESLRWGATASWFQHEADDPNRYRSVMDAEARGATAQEALEKLPSVIHGNLMRAVGMVTGNWEPSVELARPNEE